MKLFLKLIRDIKQSLGQFTAFALVVAVGAFFYIGLVTYSGQLGAYTKTYFGAHQLSDLYVNYRHLSPEDVSRLDQIDGIKKIEGRYTFNAEQVFNNDKASLVIHSVPADSQINTPALLTGSMPNNKNEILLDSHYAKEHQLAVNDQINLRAADKDVQFTISGLGENAEHAKKNDTQDHKGHGFGYVAESAIPVVAGSPTYNEVMIRTDKGYDIDHLGKTIKKHSEQNQLPYTDQISKERTFSYSMITQTIYNNKMMSIVIPFVLFLVEAIILFLAMSRIIDSQRNQIGTMKALGIKDRNILLHYMGYPVLVGIVGSILGWILAATVFIPMVAKSFERSYSLPGIHVSLSFYSVIPPIVFSSLFGIFATYLSARPLLKERAAQAMRPKPPKTMKRIVLERIPGFWRRLPYRYKLILRNIFLKKQKALASSIGVVVSTVLLITAFGTQAALKEVAGQIERVYLYDLKVDFKKGSSPDEVQLPTGIKEHFATRAYPIELIKGNEKEQATLQVTETENNLIHFFDNHHKQIQLAPNGILIPQSYAAQYNIVKGDTIKVKFTKTDQTAEMKVQDTTTQYTNPTFYSTPAYIKEKGIGDQPVSLLVKADSDKDIKSVRSFFEQLPQIDAIKDKSDLRKSAEYIMKQNNFIFVMFIVSAILLSFGAIYTISSINIYERSRELATLKVLGYQKRNINRLIFLENIFITTLAVLIALPISGWLYALVVQALSSTHQQIPNSLSMREIALGIGIAFVLTLLSNLFLRRKVNNINMIEALKSVE